MHQRRPLSAAPREPTNKPHILDIQQLDVKSRTTRVLGIVSPGADEDPIEDRASIYVSTGRCIETIGGSCTIDLDCGSGEFCDAGERVEIPFRHRGLELCLKSDMLGLAQREHGAIEDTRHAAERVVCLGVRIAILDTPHALNRPITRAVRSGVALGVMLVLKPIDAL